MFTHKINSRKCIIYNLNLQCPCSTVKFHISCKILRSLCRRLYITRNPELTMISISTNLWVWVELSMLLISSKTTFQYPEKYFGTVAVHYSLNNSCIFLGAFNHKSRFFMLSCNRLKSLLCSQVGFTFFNFFKQFGLNLSLMLSPVEKRT